MNRPASMQDYCSVIAPKPRLRPRPINGREFAEHSEDELAALMLADARRMPASHRRNKWLESPSQNGPTYSAVEARRERIMAFIEAHNAPASRSVIAAHIGCTDSAVSNAMEGLMIGGRVIRIGSGRYSRYVLKGEA